MTGGRQSGAAVQSIAHRPSEVLEQFLSCLALRLTLEMNVLMLMYFPVHVGVCVCVNVSVDFGINFGWDSRPSLAEEELLLCQVLLVVHAVFLRAGGAGRRSHAAPVPLSIRQPLGALQHLRACGRGAGRGTVLSTLAEPEQRCSKDEHYSSGDANDDRPGEGAGGLRKYGRDRRMCVCKRRGQRKRQSKQVVNSLMLSRYVYDILSIYS